MEYDVINGRLMKTDAFLPSPSRKADAGLMENEREKEREREREIVGVAGLKIRIEREDRIGVISRQEGTGQDV